MCELHSHLALSHATALNKLKNFVFYQLSLSFAMRHCHSAIAEAKNSNHCNVHQSCVKNISQKCLQQQIELKSWTHNRGGDLAPVRLHISILKLCRYGTIYNTLGSNFENVQSIFVKNIFVLYM